MNLNDLAAGFLIGVGVAILLPPAWRLLRGALSGKDSPPPPE